MLEITVYPGPRLSSRATGEVKHTRLNTCVLFYMLWSEIMVRMYLPVFLVSTLLAAGFLPYWIKMDWTFI